MWMLENQATTICAVALLLSKGKNGENMAKKSVKAPKGYHFMQTKNGLKLMRHGKSFKKHKGAKLKVKLPVVK